jgi:hypothetical protein
MVCREVLGEGGYATVKKGNLNNSEVAVKILKESGKRDGRWRRLEEPGRTREGEEWRREEDEGGT